MFLLKKAKLKQFICSETEDEEYNYDEDYKDDYGDDLTDEIPACLKPATNLALKYGFVTDLTSLVVEENENYLIKIHDPEKLKYDITSFEEYSVASQPLDTPSNPNVQEFKRKLAESGKKCLFLHLTKEIFSREDSVHNL